MPKKSGRLSGFQRTQLQFKVGGVQFALGLHTKMMGVLNVTPDSFSDGGFFLRMAKAVNHALQMEREGAHLLDVGGESTRPGSRPVSAKEEIRRVGPVLKQLLRKIKIPVSIDTYKYDVAHAALDEGAVLVNDIRGLRGNRRLARLIARYKAGVVLMHMQGDPQSMQKRPQYRDVVKDVYRYLRQALHFALAAGISRQRIAIDPGFGFGKTTEHNLALLSELDFFSSLGVPVLVGLSRKSFIGNLLGTPASERLYGSLGAAAVAIQRGAHLLRVHDVKAHRQLALLVDSAMNKERQA